MCCGVTRSDVTRVYFQHMHVNVDTETPHGRARTCEETNAAPRTEGAGVKPSAHVSEKLKKLKFRGLGSAFLHAGRCSRRPPLGCRRVREGARIEGKPCWREGARHAVMAVDTNTGLSSLLSAAAVDHTGVTFTINLNAQNH